jgi:hypothetical protein
MKVSIITPEPYALVVHNYCDYRVYANGKVMKEDFNSFHFETCPTFEDDYEEIKAAGLEALK